MDTIHLTKKDFTLLWRQLKASAKKRNIEFNISPTDICDIGIPVTCPILGIPLKFHRHKVEDDSVSFDRIDSSKGYIADNLIVISYRANKLKSNSTLEEMQKLVKFYTELDQIK